MSNIYLYKRGKHEDKFPSLISLMVSVEVKHHVYLLVYLLSQNKLLDKLSMLFLHGLICCVGVFVAVNDGGVILLAWFSFKYYFCLLVCFVCLLACLLACFYLVFYAPETTIQSTAHQPVMHINYVTESMLMREPWAKRNPTSSSFSLSFFFFFFFFTPVNCLLSIIF